LALASQDGNLVWAFPKDTDERLGAVYGAPAVAGDAIYLAASVTQRAGGFFGSFGSGKQVGALYAVRKDGKAHAPPSLASGVGSLVGSAVVAEDTVIVGSSDGYFYALSAKDGELRWKHPTGGRVWSTPAVAGDVVFFGSLDHTLYAVGLADGKVRWTFPTQGAITGTPLVTKDRVYIGSFDANLYALDRQSGSEVWRTPMDRWVWAGPVTDGDTIYVGTLGGTLYALTPADGKPRWPPVALSGPILVSPVLLSDRLVVITEKKRLHVLDSQRGRERLPVPCRLDVQVRGRDGQLYRLDGRVRGPVAAQGDLAYLVDSAANVYGINVRDCDPRPLSLAGDR
jgi:outer membrane protein assembly factor BamB